MTIETTAAGAGGHETVSPGGVSTEGAEGAGAGGDGGKQIDDETLAFARANGWVSKDEFRGDNGAQWVDAAEFADHARKINPILNRNNREMREEIRALKDQLTTQTRMTEQIAALARKQATEEYEAKIGALRAEKATAISEGDGAKVTEIEDRIDKLEKPPAAVKEAPAASRMTPAMQAAGEAFAARNEWFGDGPKSDARKTRLAMAVATEVRESHATLAQTDPPAYFAEIERRLNSDYPEIFKPARKTPPAMSDAGAAPGGSKAAGAAGNHGYKDMPKEARDVADRMMAQGYIKDKEAYAKHFFAEVEAGRITL